jgi:K+-sensing histidine kinase KdpD
VDAPTAGPAQFPPVAGDAPTGLSRHRLVAGFALCAVSLPLVTAGLARYQSSLGGESALLVYLFAVVVVAVVGGLGPAVVAALGGFLLANWFLTEPYLTLTVGDPRALTDLVIYVLVALLVSLVVEVGARDRARAQRDRLQAQMLGRLASAEMGGLGVQEVLELVRAIYGFSAVELAAARPERQASLRANEPDSSPPEPIAAAGAPVEGRPVVSVSAGRGLVLLGHGSSHGRRADSRADRGHADRGLVLESLAAMAGRARERELLSVEARRAEQLAETDRVRSALLAAVSHDLRTPLAGIKAAASSLRQPDLVWGPGEEAELLAVVEENADRMTALVENLLDMSRIQAGALSVHLGSVPVEDVVARALVSRPPGAVRCVALDSPEATVLADAGLLERVVANLIDNAVRYSPIDTPVEVIASPAVVDGEPRLHLDVVDHGPGADSGARERMFRPFQRLGDTTPGGVGLGLAIARGLVEAMGGTIDALDTPGGGLTLRVCLPRAQ